MHSSTASAGHAIVVPGAPLLVEALAGDPGDPAAAEVREAVRSAGRWLGERTRRWQVRSGPEGPLAVPAGSGTFVGFGADVVVSATPSGAGANQSASRPDPGWPVPMLIAAWLRGAQAPAVEIVGPGPLPDADDAAADEAGTVFVLDGPATLSARAPGGFCPDDLALFDAQVAAVCADGPTDQIGERWAAAAAALQGARVTTLYRGAPFGVGYLVATASLGRRTP